jgi:hypothetical protein
VAIRKAGDDVRRFHCVVCTVKVQLYYIEMLQFYIFALFLTFDGLVQADAIDIDVGLFNFLPEYLHPIILLAVSMIRSQNLIRILQFLLVDFVLGFILMVETCDREGEQELQDERGHRAAATSQHQ